MTEIYGKAFDGRSRTDSFLTQQTDLERKEVHALRESCFCGRSGELEDREPVLDAKGRWLLRCPDCGHLDNLGWLTEEGALMVWGQARRRREGLLWAA
jgi:hypothetical protein